MNIIVVLALLLVAVFALASVIASRPRGAQFTALANIGEGFQPAVKTYLADAAIASRHRVVKIGSDAAHVAVCGVGDVPLGIATDEASAAEESLAVALLGLHRDGALGVASGAIAAGDLLVPGAVGAVRTLPVAAGTYHIIGRALAAAADTAPAEFVPCFPLQRVVA